MVLLPSCEYNFLSDDGFLMIVWVGEMVATLVVTWDSGVSELNATKFTQLFSAIHYSCVQPERIALFHLVITILLIFHAVLSCILDIAFWLLYLVMGV